MEALSLPTLLQLIPDAAIVVNPDGLIVQANPLAEQLFGYAAGELEKLPLNELVPTDKRVPHTALFAKFIKSPVQRQQANGLTLAGQRRNGSIFPADITLGLVGQDEGLLVLATIRDMTAQRDAAEALRQANRALRLLSASNRTLLRSSREDNLLADVCRISVELGDYCMAWVGMAQYDAEKAVIPVAWCGLEQGFLNKARMTWAEGERGTSAMSVAIRTGTVQLRQDILNDPKLAPWHEDARARNYQSAIALPLRIQNEVFGALAIYAPEPNAFSEQEVELLQELADDLSFGIQTLRMRKAHEATQTHIQRLAYYDRLTGLPNRALFMEQLDRTIAAATAEGKTVSLLLLTLNHLHEINEGHGHAMGDQVLVQVAHLLKSRCSNEMFISRFSGGDFTIICPELEQQGATLLGQDILSEIATPFELNGIRFSVRGCIGMVVFPGDGETAAELLSKADLATSRARSMSNGVCQYRPEMGQQLARTLELAHKLELALQNNRLELYYQPKIDLLSGNLMGAEALIRWHDPELGWISPAEFIPVAEARGMMVELGNWVLHTACRQIRSWMDQNLYCLGRIAVNVSALQLEDPNFLASLIHIIEETGVPSSALELELTESVLMREPEEVITLLHELKRTGFSIAIDDFGTGYSSLAYLKRFPVDTLKIDQAFVRDMLVDQNDRAIVATIIAMAQQLGLTPVAEGVEGAEQHEALKQLGCLLAQGFHFSRPEPAVDFTRRRLNSQAESAADKY